MENKNKITDESSAPAFTIGKIYLKDASLEVPNSPEIFQRSEDWTPKVAHRYSLATSQLADGVHEVVLTVTVTATSDERTVFLVEIQQGGLFIVKNYEDSRLDKDVNVRFPRILLAYAREAIDNLLIKSGFPPLMLNQLNFLDRYNEKQNYHGGE